MADTKISALTAATTPLAGTEVLPIVQSGATVKVANNDLRPKQIQSNATSGVLQVAGPTAAATRVMTTPDANFTVARTDAAQSFTGNQTLSTGNLVIGTSGQGIDFSATPGTGTSELLADYEQGTWTPTLENVTVTYSFNEAKYTKIGRFVFCSLVISTTSIDNTDTSSFQIGGLPYASADAGYVAGSIGNNGSSAALLTTAVRNMTGVYISGSNLYLVDASTTSFPTYAGICNASGRVYVSFSYMTT